MKEENKMHRRAGDWRNRCDSGRSCGNTWFCFSRKKDKKGNAGRPCKSGY